MFDFEYGIFELCMNVKYGFYIYELFIWEDILYK